VILFNTKIIRYFNSLIYARQPIHAVS